MTCHQRSPLKKAQLIIAKPALIILCAAIILGAAACSVPAPQDNVAAPSPVPAPAGSSASAPVSEAEIKADTAVAELLKAEDYDSAIGEARAALEAGPTESLREKLAGAYMARAWYYKAKRLTTYTLKDLLSAQEAAPDYYRVYYDLGRFYNNQMMQSTGVLELARCIKLKPDFAPAYNEKSACESRIYRWQAALDDAAKAVQLDPSEAVYYYTRSLALRGLKQDKEAAADLEMVLKLSKDAALTDKAGADLKALGK